MSKMRIGYPAGYLRFCLKQDWIWIIIFEEDWIRLGSGYLFDFYNEVFLRVIQDVISVLFPFRDYWDTCVSLPVSIRLMIM